MQSKLKVTSKLHLLMFGRRAKFCSFVFLDTTFTEGKAYKPPSIVPDNLNYVLEATSCSDMDNLIGYYILKIVLVLLNVSSLVSNKISGSVTL